MKYFWSSLFFLLYAFPVFATILRVNNSGASSAEYTSLETAHEFATDGDTLMVEGSGLPYATLDVTKRLVILGPGYLLSENPLTPGGAPAVAFQFRLLPSIDGDQNSGAAGTEVRGMTFTSSTSVQAGIEVHVNDVVIAQNYAKKIFLREEVNNVTVVQNFLLNSLEIIGNNPSLGSLVFDHNIVGGSFSLPSSVGGSLQHNLFLGDAFDVPDFNGPFRNNIATTDNTENFIYPESGGQATHNTAANGQFGSDNGNNSALPEDLFRGARGNSADGRYWLKPDATAALGTAHDGSDRGPFGGERPYVLSGVPNLPFIISLDVPPVSQPAIPFTVTVRAASGQ